MADDQLYDPASGLPYGMPGEGIPAEQPEVPAEPPAPKPLSLDEAIAADLKKGTEGPSLSDRFSGNVADAARSGLLGRSLIAAGLADQEEVDLQKSQYALMPEWDGPIEGAVALAGQFVGGMTSPESWILRIPGITPFMARMVPWGRTVEPITGKVLPGMAGRFLESGSTQAIIAGGADVAGQGVEMGFGTRDELDWKESLTHAGMGAIFGLGLHGIGEAGGAALGKMAASRAEKKARELELAIATQHAAKEAERLHLAVEDPSLKSANDQPFLEGVRGADEATPEPRVSTAGDPNAPLAAEVKRIETEIADHNTRANEALDAGDQPAATALFDKVDELKVQQKAVEQQLKEADAAVAAKPDVATQHAAITKDLEEKLVAAGRPPEEAKALAAIDARYWMQRAERYKGAKGTADQIYRAEGPEILGPDTPTSLDWTSMGWAGYFDKDGRRLSPAEVEQNMAKERYLGQKPDAPAFYSAVERSIEKLNLAAADGAAWWNRLWTPESKKTVGRRDANNKQILDANGKPVGDEVTVQASSPIPGVKQEELQHLGLEDWLKEQKGPVTKEQVLDYVRANKLEIVEVKKGDPADTALMTPDSPSFDPSRLQRASTTRFGQWQLPGGTNYREVLIKLPGKTDADGLPSGYRIIDDNAEARAEGFDVPPDAAPAWRYTGPGYASRIYKSREEAVADALKQAALNPTGETFTTHHWPDDPNVVLHLRFNDRVINGKRTLFVEEVQSDWHQKGRKQGYAHDETTWGVVNKRSGNASPTFASEAEAVAYRERLPESVRGQTEVTSRTVKRGDIPDAPFKTSWPELGMKRMLRYAAEHGYDALAWTPGEEQAKRYDLSKQISELRFEKFGTGGFSRADDIDAGTRGQLVAYDHNGQKVIDKHIEASELPDAVGKDIADKLLAKSGTYASSAGVASVSRHLSGLDLKVGGEGMHSFYDRELPNVVNKLVKKYGAKVGKAELTTPKEFTAEDAGLSIARGENDHDGSAVWEVFDRNGDRLDTFNRRSDAEQFVEEELADYNAGKETTGALSVHSVDITPELRAAATEQGFPLFQSAPPLKPAEQNLVEQLTVNKILSPETPALKPRSRNVSDIAKDLMARGAAVLEKLGIKSRRIEGPEPRTDEIISQSIASEIKAALDRGGNTAHDWYSHKIEEAIAIVSTVHPEVAKDPNARLGFTAALAITSQGETVPSNVRLAEQVYAAFKKTGRFPTDVKSAKQSRMNANFQKLNDLLDKLGPDKTREFLHSQFTVKELVDQGYDIGGEVMGTRVYGSAILGPKIGGGFFQNLNSNFEPVTMDLWFMRAWGRLTGTLVGKTDISKPRARFEAALAEEGGKLPTKLPQLLKAAEEVVRVHEADYRKNQALYKSGEKVKSELTYSAERLLQNVDGINETPSSGNQRAWMRERVQRAREILAQQGVDITNADLQAIWWYPEKDLYAKLGGRDSEGINVDYASTLRKLATDRGVSDEAIQAAVRGVRSAPDRPGSAGRADVAGGQQEGGRGRGEADGAALQGDGAAASTGRPDARGLIGEDLFQADGEAKRGLITLRDDARATIRLLKDADASTFLHEKGHHYLETLLKDAVDPVAPADLVADAQAVRKWLGMADDQARPTTAQHEQFARAFEAYVMEGKAPDKALERVFAQLKEWLLQIYETASKLRTPINDDIRAVFDRMLKAPENAPEARAAAAQARGDVSYRETPRNAPAQLASPAAGTPTPAGTPHPAVKSLQDQGDKLVRELDITMRSGRVDNPKAAGIFKTGADVVRVRNVADFETVVHEIGHALEKKIGQALTNLTNQHAAELKVLDYDLAKQRVFEGYAEFMRMYVTAPAMAQVKAPTFLPAFRSFMEGTAPDLLKHLDDARTAYADFINAPSDVKLSAVVKRNEPDSIFKTIREEGLPRTIGLYLSKAYAALFDDKAPVTHAVREILREMRDASGTRTKLEGADNPENLVRLFARSHQAAAGDMMNGVTPYRQVGPQGPSLRDALIKATGDPGILGRWDDEKMAEFGDYLVARRAQVLWDKYDAGLLPNRPVSLSKADIADALTHLEAQNPTFADAGQMVHDYTRQLLRKMFEGGLIKRELFDELDAERFYVPMLRDMRERDTGTHLPIIGIAKGQDAPARSGTGGATDPGQAQVIKRLRGSDRDIIDPIQSIMTQTFLVNRTLAHNDIIKSFVQLGRNAIASGAKGVGRIVEELRAHDMVATNVNVTGALEAAAKKAGISAQDTQLLVDSMTNTFGHDPIMATIFHAEPTGKRGEPIVFWKENGELRAVRLIQGEEGMALYNTLTELPAPQRDWALNGMAASATLLRSGIVTNPTFAITNFIRDQMAATILRPDYIPFDPRGIGSVLGNTNYARMYNYAGGMSPGAGSTGVSELINQNIDQLARKGWVVQKVGGIADLVTKGDIVSGAKAIGETIETSEAGTRLNVFRTVYNQKIKQGLSEYDAMIEAAAQSTDLMDFGRHGSGTQWIRTLVPFLNAHLQGLDKFRRTLIEPLYRAATGDLLTAADVASVKNAGLGLAKMVGVGGSMGFAYALWASKHDAYRDANEELRATHLILPGGAFGKDGKILVVPKPFELAMGFNLGEMLGMWMATGDPRAAGMAIGGMWEVLAPPSVVHSIPIVKTATELALNKSLFTRRDIVPPSLMGVVPAERYTERTSSLAKAIGKAIDVAPIKVDYAIGNTFGMWGKDLLAASSTVDPSSPAMGLEDTMFLRRFIKSADAGSETTKHFWNMAAATNGTYAQDKATYERMLQQFRDDDASRFMGSLTKPERAYVTLQSSGDEETGKAKYNADEKRMHPLSRAALANTTVSGLIRELNVDAAKDSETGDRIRLDPTQRREMIDALRVLSAMEQRNAMVIMKEPGYEGRTLLSPEDQLAVIRAKQPKIADEIATRYAIAKIAPTESVARLWPEAEKRLLAEGGKAELNDLSADMKADGFAFGADRIKKPAKRRVPVPALP